MPPLPAYELHDALSLDRPVLRGLRDDFDCSSTIVTEYVSHRLTQNVRDKACSAFLAVTPQGSIRTASRIAGFFTLSPTSIDRQSADDWKRAHQQKLPLPYGEVGAYKLGWFARHRAYPEFSTTLFGEVLLTLERQPISAQLLVLDLAEPHVLRPRRFFENQGFRTLPNSPQQRTMLLRL